MNSNTETFVTRNPATGESLSEITATPKRSIAKVYRDAREAQKRWAQVRVEKRAKYIANLKDVLASRVDEVEELLVQENGKPRLEAIASDVIPSLELLKYFSSSAPKTLRNRGIRIHNPFFLHRKSYYHYWPVGTVLVISPWNFPLLLPLGDVAMALVAGNAVVLKPSEITPLVGQFIQDICDAAGFPKGLVQVVQGDGKLGQALIEAKPDKIFFTGSVATGKKVATAAAENLIPVNLELGGKDAMIVLADADLDFATSAALWGGYSNLGQCCASTERLIVHESIADRFAEMLKEKIQKLTPGTDGDLGFITYEKQKAIYEKQLGQLAKSQSRAVVGGNFSADRNTLLPTLVRGPDIEELEVFREETFGPVIAMTTFKKVEDAVAKANASPYGLLASVITNNVSLGEEVAKQLEVGTVTINEVAYTAGIPETPWGGVKQSGIGRTHADIGLMEFVNTRHIHLPRARWLTHKSLWWFPYTPFQYLAFKLVVRLHRGTGWGSWLEKIMLVPDLLWNLAQQIKREKRL